MRRTIGELSKLRETCRNAKSMNDLKQLLDAVLDHLESVERDYLVQRGRERR
jgi:hypothetical protein